MADGSGEDWSGRIDTTTAHPARRYNYWLGGKDNFAADRESGEAIARVYPAIRTTALENRYFLQRAVRFLAGEANVRQFLDIGTGIPTADNTHEVAQSVAPSSRIVYVDNDPIVLTHARALLTSTPEGATAYIDADLRDPRTILDDESLRKTLDFNQPVALMLIAIVHFLFDEDKPYELVKTLVDALPSGSYVVMTHGTADLNDPAAREYALREIQAGRLKVDARPRSHDEVAAFFTGLEVLEPGIVPVTAWRNPVTEADRPPLVDTAMYGVVARKP
ncbi:SAM-dependent methyltransferase [Dactylosporangium vinaceum]|uniref:SAM-dependent methyltransferase n=1 Tax=Dactylosporangium vinaceum TaxID=53362 RepID=A0ABV5M1M8_9ACTN|nr:SAM-dependent methyltransferase [Dactylosporangium vinaceum]UAB99255.1 SAM-dependent methyltransferase [Dactylosporangium vinaceum]